MVRSSNLLLIYVKKGVTLYLTLNALYYPELAYPAIERYLKELMNIGIEHLIISDAGMINYIHSKHFNNFKITISCTIQIINKYAIEFYNKFQPERIVLPRHVSVIEAMEFLRSYPEIDFEIFILSNKCVYDDGLCRCLHDLGSICQEPWNCKFYYQRPNKADTTEFQNRCKKAALDFIDLSIGEDQTIRGGVSDGFFSMQCSICALYNLGNYPNLKSLKLSGRGSVYTKEEITQLFSIYRLINTQSDLSSYKLLAQDLFNSAEICKKACCCMKGHKNVGIRLKN